MVDISFWTNTNRQELYKQADGPTAFSVQTPSTANTHNTRHSASTLGFPDLALDSDVNDIDFSALSAKELVRTLRSQQKQTMKLQRWILEHGQPALETVIDLERQLEIYEQERNEKVDELHTFQARLDVMDDMQIELRRHKSTSRSLLQEKDSLLLAMEESENQQRNQRRKYEAALREATKYKRLVCWLSIHFHSLDVTFRCNFFSLKIRRVCGTVKVHWSRRTGTGNVRRTYLHNCFVEDQHKSSLVLTTSENLQNLTILLTTSKNLQNLVILLTTSGKTRDSSWKS